MPRTHARWTSALMLSTLAATGIAFVGRGAEAQESKDVVTVQARILQNGVPVNADLNLTFEVWTLSSAGALLWQESQTAVPVRNGIVSVQLGVNSLLNNTFKPGPLDTSERWLAIKQAGNEIVPRIRLTAVPYAQHAGTAAVASAVWDGSNSLSLAQLAGAGLTGGGGSPLAVGAGTGITVNANDVAINLPALDGDRLQIDLSSSLNYTPDFSSTGGLAASSTDLTAHLKGISNALAGGGGGGSADYTADSPGGRLSASSSNVAPMTDVTAATSIYYLPYKHNRISLWNGSNWVLRDFSPSNESGISASLSGKSANTNYDVFAWWDTSGTPAVKLEIGTAWTNDTTRATTCTITRANGVFVKDVSGTLDKTRRYVGTIRCLAAGQTEDSNSKRFVWNNDNRVRRVSTTRDSTVSWTSTSATLVNCNSGNAAWRQDFVIGVTSEPVFSTGHIVASTNVTLTAQLDGSASSLSNVSSSYVFTGSYAPFETQVSGNTSAGLHYIQAKHAVLASTTGTFYGSAYNSGLQTILWN